MCTNMQPARSDLRPVMYSLMQRRIPNAADALKRIAGLSYPRARTVCHIFLSGEDQTYDRLERLLAAASTM